MTEQNALLDYALAHGWDDGSLQDLEQAFDTGLEETLAAVGERHCPAVEYCEMVALLLEWHRAISGWGAIQTKTHSMFVYGRNGLAPVS